MNSINIGGRLIDLSTPKVMGIVNLTPDSFFEGSRSETAKDIIENVRKHLDGGAEFIDIGGYSTRPMADFVSCEEEIKRVLFGLEVIGNEFGDDINISIDTFRSEVVKSALNVWSNGFIVNDVQAAEEDLNMLRVVSESGLPYIAMHSKGSPKTMDSLSNYADIVDDILRFFVNKLKQISEYGVNDVIFDVGFGFAKNIEQNYELIHRYEEFGVLELIGLVGVSRKRMIWKDLDVTVDNSLNGTTIVNTLLLQKGAKIIRVHDALEATQIIKLLNKSKWDF